jgi:hypothetical protein
MARAGTNTIISPNGRLKNQSLTGLTVAQVRSRFADALNISASNSVTVNDQQVPEAQVIVDGETIIFAKPTGKKG